MGLLVSSGQYKPHYGSSRTQIKRLKCGQLHIVRLRKDGTVASVIDNWPKENKDGKK